MGAPLQIVDVSWGGLTQSMPPLPDIDRSRDHCGNALSSTSSAALVPGTPYLTPKN